jgi:hypothetical protein
VTRRRTRRSLNRRLTSHILLRRLPSTLTTAPRQIWIPRTQSITGGRGRNEPSDPFNQYSRSGRGRSPRRGRDSSPGNQDFRSGRGRGSEDHLPVVDHQLPGVTVPRLTINTHPTVLTARAMVHKALHEADKEGFPLADVVETEATAKIPLAVVDKEDLPPIEAV